MPKHLILVLTLIAAGTLFVMLNFTTPAGAGPFGVLIFFAAIYALMFGLSSFVVRVLTRIMGKKVTKKTYVYSAIMAFGPIMLLLAQSLGSMSLVTVGLMVVFVLLGCFLVNKRMA